MKTVLEGVDIQRGYGTVRADDGRQAQLTTVSVEAWHIREHCEEELPQESVGQLHEGDAYIVRWTYSITTLGEPCSFEEKAAVFAVFLLYSLGVLGLGFVSGKAAETRRAEQQHSRKRADGLFFLARSSLQHQREGNLGLDDGGAGQPQRLTGGCPISWAVSPSLGTRQKSWFSSLHSSSGIGGWSVISVCLIGCSGVGE